MMSISLKKLYKCCVYTAIALGAVAVFVFAKSSYSNADFGKTFGAKATAAKLKLQKMNASFTMCGSLCGKSNTFLQSIIFPEVMRYNEIKDGIETESLRTLYTELGDGYANFSIGLFQMKPSFAVQVEQQAAALLPDTITGELQFFYDSAASTKEIRLQRVERLEDAEWQLIYLTAFVCICDKIYAEKKFATETEKLQWYATVYNAGFEKTDSYITKKIKQENFYLLQGMPEKKFKYAAIAAWYFNSFRSSEGL